MVENLCTKFFGQSLSCAPSFLIGACLLMLMYVLGLDVHCGCVKFIFVNELLEIKGICSS